MKHRTVWVVWLYMAAYAAMLALLAVVDFDMPISGATYGLMIVVGGYVGMDEFASFVASKKLPAGIKYTGSTRKLLNIVIGIFILAAEAMVVQVIEPDVILPLDQIVLAAGMVAGIYAGGNKAANAAEQEGPAA